MEVGGRRKCREMSPDMSKARLMRPTFKRVQVVYYLSRNGHLEHPHFMEVTHLAHQPLRLKDVMDRLTVLRGKGMPSLYSWSCKRNYKSGYVWNDLAENDVIHSSEGAEFVLKGSELIEGCTERLHQLQISNVPLQLNPPKRKSLASKARPEPEEMINNQFHDNHDDDEEEYEEKTSYTTSSTPLQSRRRSRGVSTDELVEDFKQSETPKNPPIEFNSSFSSPPSTTSSTSLSDKAITNESSKRFEDGDPVGTEPLLSRNSMLFGLITCGGSASFRKTVAPPASPPGVVGRKSESGSNLLKGVVCKAAAKVAVEEDEEIIRYMSENPRFGNSQAEEKEYFSGSIAESMTSDERMRMSEPTLKKSNSYNEERSTQLGGGEVEAVANNADQEVKKVKGKCIPRIIF